MLPGRGTCHQYLCMSRSVWVWRARQFLLHTFSGFFHSCARDPKYMHLLFMTHPVCLFCSLFFLKKKQLTKQTERQPTKYEWAAHTHSVSWFVFFPIGWLVKSSRTHLGFRLWEKTVMLSWILNCCPVHTPVWGVPGKRWAWAKGKTRVTRPWGGTYYRTSHWRSSS